MTTTHVIPRTVEELAGLMNARGWELGAYAYAFCQEYTFEQFAGFGIQGFRKPEKVAEYYGAWAKAIEQGLAAPTAPGKPFEIPPTKWNVKAAGDTNFHNASDALKAEYERVSEETGVPVTQIARVSGSAKAVAAAIKANPRIAVAAQQALADEYQRKLEAAKGKITCPAPRPTQDENDGLAFLLLLVRSDLKKLYDALVEHQFRDAAERNNVAELLTQFTTILEACTSVTREGSVSDQFADFLRSVG